MVWTSVVSIFKACFTFSVQALNRIVLFGETSAWDLILVFFVASCVIPLIIRAFGATGVASAGSSAVNAYRERVAYRENADREVD